MSGQEQKGADLPSKLTDIGADLYLEAKQQPIDELEKQSDKLRWKLDLIIIPIVGMTHGFQFLDKSSLSIASAYSLRQDLGPVGQQFAWCGAIFNFGFLLWSFPTNLLLQRLPIAKYTGIHLLIWSLLMMLHATAFNWGSLMAVRFFLGMAEAGIAPVSLHFVSMFYTRKESPFRLCTILSFNGLFYIISSLIGYGIGFDTQDALPRWKLIFLVYGSLNFLWGIVFLVVMPDEPGKARFLNHEEKKVAIWRIVRNMVGLKDPIFKRYQAVEAIKDPKVWLTTFMGLCAGVPLGGVTTFLSSLIEGFGFTGIQATKYEIPIGAIAFAGIILCGAVASLIPNTRCLTLIVISMVPFGCILGLRLIDRDEKWQLLGCSWSQLLALSLNCLTWAIMTANYGGHTKRAVANGLWFVFFGAGNIIGNNIFFADERPLYYSAITGLLVCYGAIMLLSGLLWLFMYLDNRSRQRALASTGINQDQDANAAILSGLQDQTDKENLSFRYTY